MKLAIIIIAAGESKRLGRAKQLLKYKNTTLLNFVVNEAIFSTIGKAIVVLGAKINDILPSLPNRGETVIYNKNWYLGMGTSIAAGIHQLDETFDGVIISLADQPYLNRNIYIEIAKTAAEKINKIIVSKYKVSQGPPTYFPRQYFKNLKSLNDDYGAKSIIQNNPNNIAYFPFENGGIDIDTIADLNYLN